MKRRIKLGNPTDEQRFLQMMASAKRFMAHQRLLWKLLRAAMAEGRRDQGEKWRADFIRLLERTARHERLIARQFVAGNNWLLSNKGKPKKPALRVVKGGRQ